jgi:hypothetical protein
MSLTYKQRLFVSYYLGASQGNAADAARKAGYAWPEKQGPQQLAKTSVRAAVEAKLNSVALTQDEILARMSQIADGDLADFLVIRVDGIKVDLKRAKRHGQTYLLKRLKTKDGDVDIELESKTIAMVKLGEYHGMWSGAKPPDISLVELAQRLKEKLERDRERGGGVGDAD